MATRTAKLASLKPPAGVVTNFFVVPNGYTYIVKSVTAFNGGGAPTTSYIYGVDAAGVQSNVLYNTVLASAGLFAWNGWLVLGPGDAFVVYDSVGSGQYWVSGTKLVGVA